MIKVCLFFDENPFEMWRHLTLESRGVKKTVFFNTMSTKNIDILTQVRDALITELQDIRDLVHIIENKQVFLNELRRENGLTQD